MTLPVTAKLAALVVAIAAGVIPWAQDAYHWTGPQTTATSGVTLTTIALAAFIVEHLRRETPSRWVGVLGLIPAEVSGVVLLGIAFLWWGESALKVSTLVLAVFTPIGALVGVTIAQAKVTSPETLAADLAATAHEVSVAKAATPDTHAR